MIPGGHSHSHTRSLAHSLTRSLTHLLDYRSSSRRCYYCALKTSSARQCKTQRNNMSTRLALIPTTEKHAKQLPPQNHPTPVKHKPLEQPEYKPSRHTLLVRNCRMSHDAGTKSKSYLVCLHAHAMLTYTNVDYIHQKPMERGR